MAGLKGRFVGKLNRKKDGLPAFFDDFKMLLYFLTSLISYKFEVYLIYLIKN
jgi:hypothetical protein